MKYYMFDQNNSGGSFIINDDLDRTVIIKAENSHEANSFAKTIGIYFGGVASGDDCECCGDRWDTVSEYGGYDTLEAVKKRIYSGGYVLHETTLFCFDEGLFEI